jgi:hypothetical protein
MNTINNQQDNQHILPELDAIAQIALDNARFHADAMRQEAEANVLYWSVVQQHDQLMLDAYQKVPEPVQETAPDFEQDFGWNVPSYHHRARSGVPQKVFVIADDGAFAVLQEEALPNDIVTWWKARPHRNGAPINGAIDHAVICYTVQQAAKAATRDIRAHREALVAAAHVFHAQSRKTFPRASPIGRLIEEEERLLNQFDMQMREIQMFKRPSKPHKGHRRRIYLAPGQPLPKDLQPSDIILFISEGPKTYTTSQAKKKMEKEMKEQEQKRDQARHEARDEKMEKMFQAQSKTSAEMPGVQEEPGMFAKLRNAVDPRAYNPFGLLNNTLESAATKVAGEMRSEVKFGVNEIRGMINEIAHSTVKTVSESVSIVKGALTDLGAMASRLVLLAVLVYLLIQVRKEGSPLLFTVITVVLLALSMSIGECAQKACTMLQAAVDKIKAVEPGMLVAQDGSWFSTISGALSVLMVSVLTGTAGAGKALEKCMNGISHFPALKTGTEDVITTVIGWLESGFNWLRNQLGLDRVQLYERGIPELDAWLKKTNEFLSEWRNKEIEVGLASRSRLNALLADAHKLLVDFSRDRKAQAVRNAIHTCLAELIKCSTAFEAANIGNQGVRACPFGLLLVGAPGVGKSLMTMPIVNQLIVNMLDTDKDLKRFEDAPDDFLYCMNAEHGFLDGYHGQAFVFVDDLGQLRYGGGTTPDNEIVILIRFLSHMPYLVHMAEISAKANTAFRSRCIIASTNGIERVITDGCINYPEAFERRWDLRVLVSIAASHAIDGKEEMALSDRRLDRSKCDPTKAYDKDAWEFSLMTKSHPKQKFWSVGRQMKHDEFVRHVVMEFRKREAWNGRYVMKVNDDLKALCQKKRQDIAEGNKDQFYVAQGGRGTGGIKLRKGKEKLNSMEQEMDGVAAEFQAQEGAEFFNGISQLEGETSLDFVASACYYVVGRAEQWRLELSPSELEKVMRDQYEVLVSLYKQGVTEFTDYTWPGLKRAVVRMLMKEVENPFDKVAQVPAVLSRKFSQLRQDYGKLASFLTYAPLLLMALTTAFALWKVFKWWKGGPMMDADSTARAPRKPPAHFFPNKVEAAAVAQGDSQAYQIAASVVKHNCYQIYMGLDSPEPIGIVTFVDGQVLLYQHHFVEFFQECIVQGYITKESAVYLVPMARLEPDIRKACSLMVPITSFMEGKEILGTGGDLRLAYISKAGAHRNITRFFLGSKDHEQEDRTLTLWTRRDAGAGGLLALQGAARRYENVNYKSGAENARIWKMPRCYGYDLGTSAGDCGSLAFVVDSLTGCRKICGIHAAGETNGGFGFAEVVTLEQLEMTLKQYPNNVRSTEEVVERVHVAQCVPPELAAFKVLGTISANAATDHSKLVPSPLARAEEYVYKAQKKPAVLGPREREGKVIDPTYKAMAKFAGPGHYIQEEIVAEAIGDVFRLIEEHDPRGKAKVLHVKEAIVGLKDDPTFGSITRGTDDGILLWAPDRTARDLPGKKRWFGDAAEYDLATKLCDLLYLRIGDVITKAELGERVFHVYKVFLKDELRSEEKVASCSTRPIFGAPLDLYIVMRMYFGSFTSSVQRGRGGNGSAVGVNPYSDEAQKLFVLLSEMETFFDGDFMGYDTSTIHIILHAICTAINNWYVRHDPAYPAYLKGEDPSFLARLARDNMVRRVLFHEIANARICVKGFILELLRSLPSGHPLTAILNTIYTMVLFRLLFMKVSKLPATSFSKFVRMIALGDDHTIGMRGIRITPLDAAQYFKTLGMDYTMADKTPAVEKTKSLEETVFLKRSFRYEPLLKRVVMALELNVILEMNLWRKKKKNWEEDVKFTIGQSIHELSLHDPTLWTTWYPRIASAARSSMGYIVPFSDSDRSRVMFETAGLTCPW